MRERIGTLTDIHKAHRHIVEVALRVFIKNPHNLSRIHRGTTANGDNHIRLERSQEARTFLRASERRIRGDVRIRREHDTLLFEAAFNVLGVAVLIKEGVGDDERTLLTHDLTQFAHSDGQATLLHIHLFRRTEPQHILSPDSHRLVIEQM